MDERDRPALNDLIWEGLVRRGDQMYAAGNNIQSEVSQLASYAANLSIVLSREDGR